MSRDDDARTIPLPILDGATAAPRVARSRNGPRRAIVLATVQVLMILHLVHWWIAGRTLAPVEPSESMDFVKYGVVNAGTIFFALALLATLVFGRFFCGWGCHIIMLQDLCGWLMRRAGIRPRAFRSRILIWVPFLLALYMFVWPVVYRWGVAPLSGALHARWPDLVPDLSGLPAWPGITLHLTTTDYWRTFAGVGVAIPFFFVCGFAIVWFLGNKGFCTYGCPYGGFFAPVEQYAPGRIRVNDDCEQCGHCTAVCTSNVRVHEEVAAYGMVVNPGCMKCLDCVSVCPKDALSFGFGRPAAMRAPARGPEPKPRHDLSLGEELGVAALFALAFFGWRGVYGLVPMLMAAGIAGCVAFIGWKAWRLVRDENLALHRRRLRFHGRLTGAGIGFLALAGVVLLLTGHAAAVSATAFLADRADGRVQIARGEIFTDAPLILPDEMAADARLALDRYARLEPFWRGGIALLPSPHVEVRRSWLLACLHDFEGAEQAMRRHIERNGPDDAASRDVAMLLRLRFLEEESEAWLRAVVAEHPEFILTVDDLAFVLSADGRFDEAIEIVAEASSRVGDDDPERSLYLLRRWSMLELESGDIDEGIRLIERTIEIDDGNPASYLVLAQANAAAGREALAMAAIERAFDRGLETPELLDAMAQLLEGIGRREEAEEFRRRAAAAKSGA